MTKKNITMKTTESESVEARGYRQGAELDITELEEMEEFLRYEHAYQTLLETHAPIFEQLRHIATRRNAAIESVDKVLRAKGVSCGPFRLMSAPKNRVNTEKLINHIGVDKFRALGGIAREVTNVEYTLDIALLARAEAEGKVPSAVVDDVLEKSCKYSKPKEIELP
jgi:hypothetical protein